MKKWEVTLKLTEKEKTYHFPDIGEAFNGYITYSNEYFDKFIKAINNTKHFLAHSKIIKKAKTPDNKRFNEKIVLVIVGEAKDIDLVVAILAIEFNKELCVVGLLPQGLYELVAEDKTILDDFMWTFIAKQDRWKHVDIFLC